MLKNTCIYKKAFEKFEEQEIFFTADSREVPDFFYQEAVKKLVDMLQHFYELTMRISSSQYVTANTFFCEIADLFYILKEWQSCDDVSKRLMDFSMKAKFDKYQGIQLR